MRPTCFVRSLQFCLFVYLFRIRKKRKVFNYNLYSKAARYILLVSHPEVFFEIALLKFRKIARKNPLGGVCFQ